MKRAFIEVRFLGVALLAIALFSSSALNAQEATSAEIQLAQAKKKKAKSALKKGKTASKPAVQQTGNVRVIDLPTVLRLAGAQNLDVQLAQAQLNEAKAKHEIARQRFFPWIMPGLAYRRHDGQIQDVSGNMFTASKQSYNAGANFAAQWELGDAIYGQLAEKQRAKAADHQLETATQINVYQAAQDYFELVKAGAQMGVAQESIRVANDYAKQLEGAVNAGLAFKGDQLRVQGQAERYQLTFRQIQERRRIASARLAQTLNLDPTIELAAADNELAPLNLLPANSALASLVAQAMNNRPEMKRQNSLLEAAKDEKQGTKYGPLIPTVGAQMYLGGLGGGVNDSWGNFKDTQDYQLLFGWKIGPGGLFDKGRIKASEARLEQAKILSEKAGDEIVRQVVEQHTRVNSLADQMKLAQQALDLAQKTVQLTRERKSFGVGIVLESIQAEQELNRVRNDYFEAVAEHNKAQYALARAIGRTTP
ncbi:MAG: putative outer membrane protein [Verrucomicrobia bacterium]|jgi:outer membrane protein TolC|nr:putative outer membrane protein [Verrucomicrobiota bacterium]